MATLAFMYLVLRGADAARFALRFATALSGTPHWVVSSIVGICQIAFLVPAILALVSLVVLRRYMRVGRMILASVVCLAVLALMVWLVGRTAFPLGSGRGGRHRVSAAASIAARSDYGIGAAFPTVRDLGVIGTWMFVDRGHWSARWRRIGWTVLLMGAVAHVGVSLAHPATVITAFAAAGVAAALVQIAFGVPNTRPRAAVVGQILQHLGHRLSSVERFGGFHGFDGFRVGLDDGRQLFVKIISRDSWAALLPVRLYRTVRFRDVGQEQPFRSLRSGVEHEALCALKAHSDGVPTARLAVVSEFPPAAMMVAFDSRPFRSLRELEPERRTPELLTAVWSIVAALQRSHTVHRRLNADSLLVDDDGRVVLVDFSSASLGVVGSELSTDVAEVLAATAATLGVERAVGAAMAGVGRDAVIEALPRLQPLALTPPTRALLKSSGCLDELREMVQRATGAEPVPIAELERVKLRTIASIVMVAVVAGTLIPQFLGLGSLWGDVRHANWWWALAALGCSVITYIGAAIALEGSVSERLPFGPNMGVQLATSFVGVAAPGGSLALTTRFLQQRGVGTAEAVAAVGVDTIAGGIVHLTLTGVFLALAGTSGLSTFGLPSFTTMGLIASGVALLAVLGVMMPWSRSLLATHVVPVAKRSVTSVGELARRPSKVIELFGGSLVVTLGYIMALAVSVQAFGSGPAFTSVALVYLIGAGVSSVAPTPGGIGAVEAALIAGLTSAGMASTTAVAAVILFRVTTFWLPLVPGWAALTVLQRSGDL
jgi:undecaprenyl-diphosphatase